MFIWNFTNELQMRKHTLYRAQNSLKTICDNADFFVVVDIYKVCTGIASTGLMSSSLQTLLRSLLTKLNNQWAFPSQCTWPVMICLFYQHVVPNVLLLRSKRSKRGLIATFLIRQLSTASVSFAALNVSRSCVVHLQVHTAT